MAEQKPNDPDATSDADLVLRYLAGDREAFSVLWSRYERRLRCLAKLWGTHPNDVDDVLNNAAINASSRMSKLRDAHAVGGWLNTILRRIVIDYHRRKAHLPQSLPFDGDRIPGRPVGPVNKLPSEEFEDKEFAVALHQCLDELRPELREAVMLHCLEQAKFKEIAQRQGVDISTAQRRCERAIKALKACLVKKGM